MTTATDLYSTVFFQDGQQFTYPDANAMQRFMRAMVTDQILQSLVGSVANAATRPDFGGDDGADVSTLWAYCVSPGHAFLRQGSANHKIQIAPGTLLQKIANADGADSTLVPFTFAGTEEFTLTNGDATNPRVDLLQMALVYVTDTPANVDFQDAATRVNTTVAGTATRRRLQCTLNVKAGAPAASPTIPDPDAGCVPVGTVVVGHGWTTGGNAPIFGQDIVDTNNAVVHDQRMPIRVATYRIDPATYKLETAWSLARVNTAVSATSGTNTAFAVAPTRMGRLIGIDILADVALTANATVIGNLFTPSGSNPSVGFKPSNTLVSTLTGVTARSLRVQFEAAHVPASGPVIQQSVVKKYGMPIWLDGERDPTAPPATTMAVRFLNHANATVLYETVLYVAY